MKACLVIVAISCLVGVLNAQSCNNGVSCYDGTCYTVQSGNTVSGIVGGNENCIISVGTTNGINVNSIYPGQTLCIPSGCYSYSSGYYGNTGNNYNTCANGASCAGGTCYTVQSGNTVSGIVGGNQNCINSVGSTNGLSNVNSIYVGQTLCIPNSCNSYASAYNTYNNGYYYTTSNNYCPGGTVVTVQSGNTVGGFVGGNQACISAVGAANGLANVNNINVGQSLCIPSGCNGFYTGGYGYNSYNCAYSSVGAHTIVSGDTCQAIANQYGISLSQLYACNPWINSQSCNNLYPGQVVTL